MRRSGAAVWVGAALHAAVYSPGCGGAADGPAEVTIKAFPDGVPSALNRPENAILVAFQDGDGPWRGLAGDGGVYHAAVSDERYGVAIVCVGEFPTVDVYYQALADTRELLTRGCPHPAETAHIQVDLGDVPDAAAVSIGAASASAHRTGVIEVDAPKGPADVFARRYGVATDQDSIDVVAYRGPALDVQSDQHLAIDLTAAGRPLEFHPLRVDGVPTGLASILDLSVNSRYFTPHSYTEWTLHTSHAADPIGAPVDRWATIDPTMRAPGDVASVIVALSSLPSSGRFTSQIARSSTATPASQSVELPAVMVADAPITNPTGNPRVSVTVPIVPSKLGNISYVTAVYPHGSGLGWLVTIQPGWAAGQTSVTVAPPDLSGIPGWTPGLEFPASDAVDWSIGWIDRNMPIGTLPVDGRRSVESTLFSVETAARPRVLRSPAW